MKLRFNQISINQATKARLLVTISFIIVLASCIAYSLSHNNTGIASAADVYDSCVSTSGADQVASIQRACRLCSESPNAARGTLWFNSSNTNKNSNVVKVDDPNASEVTIYLWGQVYSCSKKSTSANTAQYIWIGPSGHDDGNSITGNIKGVDFIVNNNAGLTLSRGVGTGKAYTWYSPSNNYTTLKLNLNTFRNYPDKTCTTDMRTGIETCKVNVSVNRCFSNVNGGYLKPSTNGACYGEDSTIIIEFAPRKTTSMFNSWSYASADGLDAFNTFDSGPDSTQERSITTDKESIQVNFDHQLSYIHPTINGNYAQASTYWNTQVTIDGSPTEHTSNGYYTPNTSGPAPNDDYSTNDLGRVNVNVTINAGESKKVCSTIYYRKKYIAWQEVSGQSGNYIVDDANSEGEASSTACVIIKRGVSTGSGSEFTSQSFGKVTVDGETMTPTSAIDGMMDSQEPPIETAEDYAGKAGFASFSIDIDQESIDLDFWHLLYYKPDSVFKEKDTAPGVETKWESKIQVKTSGKRTMENNHPADSAWKTIATASGKFSPKDTKKSDTSKQLPSENRSPITISLEKGQTALVCSTIEYAPKYITFKVKENGDHDGKGGHSTDHLYYDYEVDKQTGGGASQSCIKIYRPTEPEGTPWSGNNGDAESNPLFAGEATTIGWNVWAQGSMTDRLTSYQAINYVASANTGYSDILQGTYKSYVDPCSFYRPLWGSTGLCTALSSFSGGTQSIFWDERNDPQAIVSPNEVGRKHGNSAGYFYEKWRCVPNGPPRGGCTWKHVGPDYWSIYNTAARTVFKRPSVAIWNGGLFTSGNVDTSIAKRYDVGRNALNVPLNSVDNTVKMFGSWTEYLEVIGGRVTGMTSGTVLSNGLDSKDFNIVGNSPLTVANEEASDIGFSGINNDSILYSRLQDYLFSKVPVMTGNFRSSSLGLNDNMSGTTIININGTLEIDQDIKVNVLNGSSIYTLPQVIIFASNGIKVAKSVNQIDAWLVTKGELNTCSNFRSGDTEANISERPTDECSKSLTFNGPIIAGSVKLNRSYGADGISNDDYDLADGSDTRAATAEVFNLSADAYLWAYAQSGRYGSSYSEAYSRELPPRY